MAIEIGPLPAGARVADYLYPNMEPSELHQDLLTVELANGTLIEVGWFPEYDEGGRFWIHASWETGETPPIPASDIAEVRLHVRALIEQFSRPQFSVTGSTASTKRIPRFSLSN